MANEIADGIRVTNISSNITLGRTGTKLYLSYEIEIGEAYEVAKVDAEALEDIITYAVHDIVSDYAEDGQEVD